MSDGKPRFEIEQAVLQDAQGKGSGAKLQAYIKLSGPGWLQSAITLGGGSLASGLFLGVIGGYEMLWVQWLAMFFGATMLSAVTYVTLSTEQSPFVSIRRHINPVLAWGWLLASLLANMVWVLPQCSLAYGALTNNLFVGPFAEIKDELWCKLAVTVVLMLIVVPITLSYGGQGRGIKFYEMMLKAIVGLIVLSFFGVVFALAGQLEWGVILSGFVPNFSLIFEPSTQYQEVLATIGNESARAFWNAEILAMQRDIMIAAAATAVGINMTFLLPFSLLAKKWNRSFRGFAIFDLWTGMVIPFVIATSCIVIAAASQFHGKPFEGLLSDANGNVVADESHAQFGEYSKLISKRNGVGDLETATLDSSEMQVAAMLLKRGTGDLAKSLKTLFNESDLISNYVFGFGVLAMAISTISILMLISGFCVVEALGLQHGGAAHKLGTLLPLTGLLWPWLWDGASRAYLAVPTSVFGFVLIPIAYLVFFLMTNSRTVLGEHLPSGGKRLFANVLLGVAFCIMAPAAAWKAWLTNLTIGTETFAIGRYALILFVVLVVAGFFLRSKKSDDEPVSG